MVNVECFPFQTRKQMPVTSNTIVKTLVSAEK